MNTRHRREAAAPERESGLQIETSLGSLRRGRGLSAIALASAVGVSRQTIYAMEGGSFVPNTAVALRLARTLNCTVEELFALPSDMAVPKTSNIQATLLPGADPVHPGQPVRLCRVDKRLIASAPSPMPWYLPATDAVVVDGSSNTQVQPFQDEAEFTKRILIAGCDPGISVLSRHLHGGAELVLAHRNSSQSLALLKQGAIHVAGTHLTDHPGGESNLPEIARLFPKNSVVVISFAVWEQGILTAKGNPKNIAGISDFGRKDVVIINREEGAGSRVLLDRGLKQAGIAIAKVKGYHRQAAGHLPAAWHIQNGDADCCVATRAASRMLGLHFIPLVSERYDFVVRKRHLDLPGIQNLFDTLSRSDFRRELDGLGGYDTRASGRRVL